MPAGLPIDELRSYANALPRFTDTSLENVANAEISGDLIDGFALLFVRKG